MKRILTALVAAATLAGAAVASSASAEARWGWGWGLGGLAAGAVIGSALARRTTIRTAITRRIPIPRRPACGAVYGTTTLGFVPACNRAVA